MEFSLLPYWVLMCVALFAKSLALACYQVVIRIRYRLYATPEDKSLFQRFALKGERDRSNPQAKLQRIEKCWRNDFESIPIVVFIALGFVLLDGPLNWGMCYFSIYTVARICHTLFYLSEAQPWRGMSWDLGTIAASVMAIHSAVLAFDLI